MNNTMSDTMKGWKLAYQVFKYLIYAALSYNVYMFFVEEYAAMSVTFKDGITSPFQLIEAFPSTIDTAAWVLLLYLFEAETFVLSDDTINGRAKYPLIALKAVCYSLIAYASYGYISKLIYVLNTSVADISDACSVIEMQYALMVDLDEYVPLSFANCKELSAAVIYQINGTTIVGTQSVFEDTAQLAFIDVLNSLTWLLIVVALEVDVRLQLAGKLTDKNMRVGYFVKGILYLTLFACAAYWGFYGDFIDFWDAFLWLIGFFMIELNIFNWHEEVKEEIAAQ